MKPKLIYSIVFVLLCCSAFSQPTFEYSKSTNYGNVNLSLEDLKTTVSDIQSYCDESVKDTSNHSKNLDFMFKLSNDYTDRISLSTPDQVKRLTLKKKYTDLRLRYYSNCSSISMIFIGFDDYSRELLVRGSNKSKVEALFNKIDLRVKKKETKLSWIRWHSFMLFFYMMSVGVVATVLKTSVKKIIKKKAIILAVLPFILGCVYLVFLFIATPLGTWFSRVVIGQGITSWPDIRANFIGVSAIIITILGLLYSIYTWSKEKLRLGT